MLTTVSTTFNRKNLSSPENIVVEISHTIFTVQLLIWLPEIGKKHIIFHPMITNFWEKKRMMRKRRLTPKSSKLFLAPTTGK